MGHFLVTGVAGFIGYHMAERLLRDGHTVMGIDNLSDYYDVGLKNARLERLRWHDAFRFRKIDIAESQPMQTLFQEQEFDTVVHLAAQPGVRYSIERPELYAQSNLVGFLNILEGCRHARIGHLVFASSSSIYGDSMQMPYSPQDCTDHPLSLYAATKKANELMAHSYSHLYGLPVTGLRFFTVYGDWGRPDMAIFLFTKAIVEGKPIKVFNHGRMKRDFTHVDDIVEGVARVAARPPRPDPDYLGEDPSRSRCPYRIYNLGNSRPVELERVICLLEERLGRSAIRELLPLQAGDVLETFADVEDLETEIGYRPAKSLEEGLSEFVSWYFSYYGATTTCLGAPHPV
jgi:UDP-glucuronate 4-epimerase